MRASVAFQALSRDADTAWAGQRGDLERVRERRLGRTVGDLARDVVRNMGLANAVKHERADEAKAVAVDGAEGSLSEGPLAVGVVRNERVGVLEEGDGDEPVVDVEVRNDVVGGNLSEAAVVGPGGEGSEKDSDAGV